MKGLNANAVIPPLKYSKMPIQYDRIQYKHRNLAVRYWSDVKQRRVATRYDKL